MVKAKGSVITRRSAGIPSLIVAVLSADPSSSLFERAMQDLNSLALLKEGHLEVDELPQVHALNSLKAIFTSSKLAAISDGYIVPAIGVAASCLGSNM